MPGEQQTNHYDNEVHEMGIQDDIITVQSHIMKVAKEA